MLHTALLFSQSIQHIDIRNLLSAGASRERERMQWPSCVSRNSMIQGAEEELEILEFQHPNKFDTIKLELKAFISELQSQNLLLRTTSISPCPSAATQESSSRKKRKKSYPVEESKLKAGSNGGTKRRCKTDAVLERAQQCLHKIRHLKTSFF